MLRGSRARLGAPLPAPQHGPANVVPAFLHRMTLFAQVSGCLVVSGLCDRSPHPARDPSGRGPVLRDGRRWPGQPALGSEAAEALDSPGDTPEGHGPHSHRAAGPGPRDGQIHSVGVDAFAEHPSSACAVCEPGTRFSAEPCGSDRSRLIGSGSPAESLLLVFLRLNYRVSLPLLRRLGRDDRATGRVEPTRTADQTEGGRDPATAGAHPPRPGVPGVLAGGGVSSADPSLRTLGAGAERSPGRVDSSLEPIWRGPAGASRAPLFAFGGQPRMLRSSGGAHLRLIRAGHPGWSRAVQHRAGAGPRRPRIQLAKLSGQAGQHLASGSVHAPPRRRPADPRPRRSASRSRWQPDGR
jgi:hypothetical protein